jgi:predicted dehydrogenase
VSINSVVGDELVLTSPDFNGAYFGASGAQGGGFVILGSFEAQQWIRAIKEDTDPLVLPEQACVVTEILDAIYKAAESGKPVYFD